jgi:periplasmic protein TonB
VSAAVDDVLATRARRARHGPEAASLAAALLLHALALAAAVLLPRLQPPPKPLDFVAVQIVPAQALGVRHPAAAPAPSRPEPAAAARPEPAPPPAPRAKAAEPEPEAPVLPTKEKRREAATPPPPTKPAAGVPGASSAPGETGGERGRRGAPAGNPLGTSSFGSEIAGLDNPDFTYGYYIDQLLSRIDSNWARPPLGGSVRAIISFRIGRDGGLSGLRVEESSGYNSFDLAALRAVQNASPFPPLPRAYGHDSLGVNLIVH